MVFLPSGQLVIKQGAGCGEEINIKIWESQGSVEQMCMGREGMLENMLGFF